MVAFLGLFFSGGAVPSNNFSPPQAKKFPVNKRLNC